MTYHPKSAGKMTDFETLTLSFLNLFTLFEVVCTSLGHSVIMKD